MEYMDKNNSEIGNDAILKGCANGRAFLFPFLNLTTRNIYTTFVAKL